MRVRLSAELDTALQNKELLAPRLQTAPTRSSARALVRGRRGGLRLLGPLGFQGFWGACACPPVASSSLFCSAVSNSALKRTRILRAAYLGR